MLRKLDFLNFFDAIVLTDAQYIEQNPMVLSEFVIIRTQCTNEGYLQVTRHYCSLEYIFHNRNLNNRKFKLRQKSVCIIYHDHAYDKI